MEVHQKENWAQKHNESFKILNQEYSIPASTADATGLHEKFKKRKQKKYRSYLDAVARSTKIVASRRL